MSIIFDLPAALEQRMRADGADLNAQAKENMLVELYRQDKLSRYELAQALGLNRFQTEGLLKKHNVTEDLPTNEELEADFEWLQKQLSGDR